MPRRDQRFQDDVANITTEGITRGEDASPKSVYNEYHDTNTDTTRVTDARRTYSEQNNALIEAE